MGEFRGSVSSAFTDVWYELTSSADFDIDRYGQATMEHPQSLAFRRGESTASLNCVYPEPRSCSTMCQSLVPNQFQFIHENAHDDRPS